MDTLEVSGVSCFSTST